MPEPVDPHLRTPALWRRWDSDRRPAPVDLLGPAFSRLQAALFLLGSLVGIVAFVAEPAGIRRAALLGLALTHGAVGLVLGSRLGRSPRTRSLLLPALFLSLATAQGVMSSQPGTFATLAILGFVWVGATRPRGASVRLAPLLAGGCSVIVWSHGVTGPAVVEAGIGIVVALSTGEVLGWVMDRLLATDAAMRSQDARFRSLVQRSFDALVVCVADTTVTYESPSLGRVLGYRYGALERDRLSELIHPEDRAVFTSAIADALDTPANGTTSMTARWRHADGTWRHMASVITNLLGDDAVVGLVLNSRDVTERVQLEDELTRQALTDSLTGLANRALFGDRVDHATAAAARRAEPMAVVLLDLDDFKAINDTLGHAAGDGVLRQIAERLAECVRPGDTCARLGGDEFAILLEAVSDGAEALSVAERAVAALVAPIVMDGRDIRVTTSAGIALRDAAQSPEELLRNADVAMYVAKARGGSGCALFEASMHQQLAERVALESDLRRALDRDEFAVHYQPVVDLATARVAGVEALLRWRHPQRGLLAPASFLEVAERTGLIVDIGRWVLGEACRQTAEWHRLQAGTDALSVAVNVSARQLQNHALIDDVALILEETGLTPSALLLEITESVMLADDPATIGVLESLRRLGVRLAIDDFGTGYSSLSYLQRLPVDVLKIDKSFVDHLAASPEAEVVVRAILDVGHALRLETIAEGVEDQAQREILRTLGSELAQGYLFARPLPASEVVDLLGCTLDAKSATAART